LSHITDGESTKRRIVRERFNNHWLGWFHLNHASITVLDELGVGFKGLTSSAIHLFVDVLELGGNVAGVAIKDWGVAVLDLAWVRHDDDLGLEGFNSLGGVLVGVGGNITSLDILDGNVLAVESDVVTWDSLSKGLVVHFDGLDFSGEANRTEGDKHVWLEDTGLNTADWDCADTTDLVHVLEGKTKGLLSVGLFGGVTPSRASRRIGPLYHGMFSERSIMLSPIHPEMGTKGILAGLYPTFFK